MNYKVLGVSTQSKGLNIGDYIQGLAASQFLPSIDGFVQREFLNKYDEEPSKVIMNGWFMHEPLNWPPAENIKPLFVSFHMNVLAREELLSEKSIAYFKKHEPIGCRDYETANVLKDKGIDAYFSGCLTLTLGKKYFSNVRENKCYFVDPYFITKWNIYSILKNFCFLIFNWKDISLISDKFPESKTGLRKKMILTNFYKQYRKIFTRETLINAEYINQQSIELKQKNQTEAEYLNDAEDLVKKYSRAKLVVTSRIHCALPCLGLQTPVIYIEDQNQSEASKCRLDGLRELFNIINWDKGKLEPQFEFKNKLSILNMPKNKDNWKSLADKLILSVSKFVEG